MEDKVIEMLVVCSPGREEQPQGNMLFGDRTSGRRLSIPVLLLLLCVSVRATPSVTTLSPHAQETTTSVSGVQQIAVILVQFANLGHTIESQAIEDKLGRLNSYFQNVSYGKISLTWTISGWLTLHNALEFYGQDIVQGTPPLERGDLLLIDSIKEAQDSIDFAAYRHIAVVHAGPDQRNSNETSDLWPAYWPKQALNVTTENGAFYVSEFAGVGAYAHEFCHSLGLPDLYPRDKNKPRLVGDWSLMDSGGWLGDPRESSPSGLDAWSLIQLGWIEPADIIVGPAAAESTIFALETPSATRALKLVLNGNLYYLAELRMLEGVDVALPHQAIVVSFINETARNPRNLYDAYGVVNSTALWVLQGEFVEEPFADRHLRVYVQPMSCDIDRCTVKTASVSVRIAALAIPSSTDLFRSSEMTATFVDVDNKPISGLGITLLLDGQPISLVTDQRGQIHYTLTFQTLGEHRVEIDGPVILYPPPPKKVVEARLPLAAILALLFLFALVFVGIIALRHRRRRERAIWLSRRYVYSR